MAGCKSSVSRYSAILHQWCQSHLAFSSRQQNRFLKMGLWSGFPLHDLTIPSRFSIQQRYSIHLHWSHSLWTSPASSWKVSPLYKNVLSQSTLKCLRVWCVGVPHHLRQRVCGMLEVVQWSMIQSLIFVGMQVDEWIHFWWQATSTHGLDTRLLLPPLRSCTFTKSEEQAPSDSNWDIWGAHCFFTDWYARSACTWKTSSGRVTGTCLWRLSILPIWGMCRASRAGQGQQGPYGFVIRCCHQESEKEAGTLPKWRSAERGEPRKDRNHFVIYFCVQRKSQQGQKVVKLSDEVTHWQFAEFNVKVERSCQSCSGQLMNAIVNEAWDCWTWHACKEEEEKKNVKHNQRPPAHHSAEACGSNSGGCSTQGGGGLVR